tara:strand:- start:2545 stop:2850 length:306 start_codon:yes stop_codon:yes gene_type:complete
MTNSLLSGLIGAGALGGGLTYAGKSNPEVGQKISDFFAPPPGPEKSLLEKGKDMATNVATSEHTPKVLAALALAGLLGYGGFKMGENNKMKQLERAALGIR